MLNTCRAGNEDARRKESVPAFGNISWALTLCQMLPLLLHLILTTFCEVNFIIILILQVRILRLIEVTGNLPKK